MGIGRWSELRAVRVCQLVEDANKTSGDLGAALLDTLVRESQLRVPLFEAYIISARFLPWESVDLVYDDGWCALK